MAVLRKRIVTGAALVLVGAVSLAQAGVCERLNICRRWSSKSRIDTLIITGNYAKSRLLAERIQSKTAQPILLLSPENTGMELYFLPGPPAASEAMPPEPEEKFGELVDHIRPARILILGEDAYVPERFVEILQGRYPCVRIDGPDWVMNAEAASRVCGYRKLTQHYQDDLAKFETGSRRPTAEAAADMP